jgi:hypothetical protein
LSTQEAENYQTETGVRRKKLNIQFGELTGIPSALGMTSGDANSDKNEFAEQNQESDTDYEDDIQEDMPEDNFNANEEPRMSGSGPDNS